MATSQTNKNVSKKAAPPLPQDHVQNLLRCMKLVGPQCLQTYGRIHKWVLDQRQVSDSEAIAVSLLLQRLLQAFEQRTKWKDDSAGTGKTTGGISKSKQLASEDCEKPKPPMIHDDNMRKSTNSASSDPQKPSSDNMQRKRLLVSPTVLQRLLFLGSDLFKVLHLLGNNNLTVADVASHCLKVLGSSDLKTAKTEQLCEAVYRNDEMDSRSNEAFRVFCIQALGTIRSQAVQTTELAFDFDIILFDSVQSTAFLKALQVLPEYAQAAWKLTRRMVLKQQFEANLTRRNAILAIATSLVLVAILGIKLPRIERQSSLDLSSEGSAINVTTLLQIALKVSNNICAQLAWTSPTHMNPIQADELEHEVLMLMSDICGLPMVRLAPPEEATNSKDLSDTLWNTFCTTVPKLKFLRQHLHNIIDALVLETQQRLHPLTILTNPIQAVIFLAPTVVGEPWGIPPQSPQKATQRFCRSTSACTKKPSIAVVVTSNKAQTTDTKSPKASKITMRSPKHSTSEKKGKTKRSKDEKNTIAASAAPFKPTNAQPFSIVKNHVDDAHIRPPIFTETMELNEWTSSLLSLSTARPSARLLELLGGSSANCLRLGITPVLNRAITRFPGAPALSTGQRDGQVYVQGEVTPPVQFCAAVVAFFYHSLEAMLLEDPEKKLQGNTSFYRGLLACCFACVLKAVDGFSSLPMSSSFRDLTIYGLLEMIESSPYAFLKVSESFYGALTFNVEWDKKDGTSPIVRGLPSILQRHIRMTEVQIVESVVWATSSTLNSRSEGSLIETIRELHGQPGSWPPDVLQPILFEEMEDLGIGEVKNLSTTPLNPTESTFLSYVLRKIFKLAFSRIEAMCIALNISTDLPVATQIFVGFRYLLRHHIDMLFDRHVDQLILATIYGICRVLKVKPEVTFSGIVNAYVAIRGPDIGEHSCQMIIRRIKLDTGKSSGKPNLGDIIIFYNEVFVPKMKSHLAGSQSLLRTAHRLEIQAAMMASPQGFNPLPPFFVAATAARYDNTVMNVIAARQMELNSNQTGFGTVEDAPNKRKFSEIGDPSKLLGANFSMKP